MRSTRIATFAAAAALLGALSAAPADAQGKGKAERGNRDHPAAQAQGNHGRGSKARPAGSQAARSAGKARAERASGRGSTTRGERPRLARTNRDRMDNAKAARAGRNTARNRVVDWDDDYEGRSGSVWGWDDERYRLSTRRHRDVPPGWCQGVGNPHNTVANCGPGAGRYDSRDGVYRDDDGIYRDRDDRYGSFEEAHAAFHRHHDQVCRERADDRPLDPAWQLRVRTECSAEHDRWHDRYDPSADRSRVRIRLPI
ncbi:MAG TPA: hypothetical protein VHG28_24715 [Longimicrobiaceae bacterium]|nr:hypothetical protein [Longimicrobiaceae bacterium]